MEEVIIKSGFDEILIERIANKDLEALKEIYEVSSSVIYGLALSITKNKEDAEDILHDTYIKLVEKAYTYKPQGKPLAWLCMITKNLSLMKLRKRKNEKDQDINYAYIEKSDDKIILKSAFASLNSEELQIVSLYSFGFKHKEIAEILDIPLSTVLSKYHRSLKKMKKFLEGGDKHEI